MVQMWVHCFTLQSRVLLLSIVVLLKDPWPLKETLSDAGFNITLQKTSNPISWFHAKIQGLHKLYIHSLTQQPLWRCHLFSEPFCTGFIVVLVLKFPLVCKSPRPSTRPWCRRIGGLTDQFPISPQPARP